MNKQKCDAEKPASHFLSFFIPINQIVRRAERYAVLLEKAYEFITVIKDIRVNHSAHIAFGNITFDFQQNWFFPIQKILAFADGNIKILSVLCVFNQCKKTDIPHRFRYMPQGHGMSVFCFVQISALNHLYKTTLNLAPPFFASVTEISPPQRVRIFLTRARPKPLPSDLWELSL